MIKVEMELYDSVEIQGFSKFVINVENYRAQLAQPRTGVQTKQDDVVDAGYAEEVPAQDPAVVDTITPKPDSPSDGDMNTAATAFLRKHGNAAGVPKLLDLLKQFGATKLPDVTDPGKRAELYAALVEGAK